MIHCISLYNEHIISKENVIYVLESSRGFVYVCETWSLKLVEELRLRVLKNRMLRRISGLKRDEIIKENKMGRTCCTHAREEKEDMHTRCW